MKIAASIEIVSLLMLTVVSPFVFPQTAQATTNTQLRQEVNITDAYYYAASGATATTSELVSITDSNYSDPNYYFEVVASTTAGTNASVALVNPTTGATVASVTVSGGNTYTRYRSTQFLPSASTSVQYAVRLNGESIGKGIIAARIVVLQNTASLTKTETQIEIGNNETYTSTATSSLASPKYWYYNAAGWDGSPTFTASVTYNNTVAPTGLRFASSTTYSTAGTFTYIVSPGATSTDVELWGTGGNGSTKTTNGGGGGGSGGAYAATTHIAVTPGASHTIVIGTAVNNDAGASRPATTYDTTTVVAAGGTATAANSATGATAQASGASTGSTIHIGGAGSNSPTGTTGGGGGGSGGSAANGNSAVATATGATAVTNGGNGGNGASTNNSDGFAPTTPPGGGGGGGNRSSNGTRLGGAGAVGKAKLTEYGTSVIQATTTIALQEDNGQFGSWTDKAYLATAGSASSATLTSAVSFTPTNGKHYRIAFKSGYNGATFAIYNAKIVVNQALITSDAQTGQTIGSTGAGTISDTLTTLNNNDWVVDAIDVNTISAGFASSQTNFFTAACSSNNQGASYKSNVSPIGFQTMTWTTAASVNASHSVATLVPSAGNLISIDSTTDSGCLSAQNPSWSHTASAGVSIVVVFVSYGGVNIGGTSSVTYGGVNMAALQSNESTGDNSGIWYLKNPPSGAQTVQVNTGNPSGTRFESASVSFNNVGLIFSALEPQYLLANTKYASGTSLQNFLTRFDPAEWTTTNNYLNAVSSGASSASVAGVYNAGTVLTNSTITSPNNYATSTLGICMPAVAADFDTKATTNNNDLYSDSIVVQVGVASTAGSCTTGPAATGLSIVLIKAQMIVREPTVIK